MFENVKKSGQYYKKHLSKPFFAWRLFQVQRAQRRKLILHKIYKNTGQYLKLSINVENEDQDIISFLKGKTSVSSLVFSMSGLLQCLLLQR